MVELLLFLVASNDVFPHHLSFLGLEVLLQFVVTDVVRVL